MERHVIVANKEGLHARPAALFVKAAAEQPVKVTIRKVDGEPVDADSILGLMTLGVAFGDEVVLTADDGDRTDAALQSLATLLETSE